MIGSTVEDNFVWIPLHGLVTYNVPEWMTRGKTSLIMKDKEKGPIVSNFRPITCLPLMWKLLTSVLSDAMYEHLEGKGLLVDEQKGCRRKSRGTKDQLLIDKMVMRSCKRRLCGLGMAWIDYRKAYDLIPHTWLLKCMNMFGLASNMVSLLENSMNTWRTELTSGKNVFGEVPIKRGIFQGDSLSPLLFVLALIPLTLILRDVKAGYDLREKVRINHLLFMDDLKLYDKNEKQIDTFVNTVRVFSNDIRMEFGISKCAILVMKRGKMVKCDGIVMPGNEIMKGLEEAGYKYLGILEIDNVKHEEMKENLKREYIRRVRKILKSKLNGGNIIQAINARAVSIIRYGAGIINWRVDELKAVDRKTRKLLTINRALHPQADVDRLYYKRADGGRGLISVEDCVEIEVNSLFGYLERSKEPFLKAVKEENLLSSGTPKEAIKEKRMKSYKEKVLHGQYEKLTAGIRSSDSWEWLRKGTLKKETEGMLMAAQDQALRTNAIKSRIDKQDVSPICRMCGKREESIAHVVAECEKLAQNQYKNWRHDRVGKVIHWELCKKYDFDCKEKWYDHIPEGVLENEKSKILWDFRIQTDQQLNHNRPDIVLHDKEKNECKIIDVSCPFDGRVIEREEEKREKYEDLRREVAKLWCVRKVVIIPIIIGALGTLSKNFKRYVEQLEMGQMTSLLQKTCVLGTAKIIRRTLDT